MTMIISGSVACSSHLPVLASQAQCHKDRRQELRVPRWQRAASELRSGVVWKSSGVVQWWFKWLLKWCLRGAEVVVKWWLSSGEWLTLVVHDD